MESGGSFAQNMMQGRETGLKVLPVAVTCCVVCVPHASHADWQGSGSEHRDRPRADGTAAAEAPATRLRFPHTDCSGVAQLVFIRRLPSSSAAGEPGSCSPGAATRTCPVERLTCTGALRDVDQGRLGSGRTLSFSCTLLGKAHSKLSSAWGALLRRQPLPRQRSSTEIT